MKGIDISEFQQNVDYLKLKEAGVDFAIIRIGYGRFYKDIKFEEHYAGLKYVGIKVGVYLYSYADTNEKAKEEADFCLKILENRKLDLPVFYDVEEVSLNKQIITENCKVFCETIEKAGYTAGVYANLYWFNNFIKVDDILKYKIWLAQWDVKKHDAKFKVDYWQYTNKGTVNGIYGRVDLNESYKQVVDNSVEKFFEYGKVYTTQVDLNIRVFAGTEHRVKFYSEITLDGRKHAYNQIYAVLKKGTRVTVLSSFIKNENEIWVQIPSRLDMCILLWKGIRKIMADAEARIAPFINETFYVTAEFGEYPSRWRT